ncbi:MAG: hypothetical protein ABIK68_03180, partial [bacterium]
GMRRSRHAQAQRLDIISGRRYIQRLLQYNCLIRTQADEYEMTEVPQFVHINRDTKLTGIQTSVLSHAATNTFSNPLSRLCWRLNDFLPIHFSGI